MGFTRSSSSPWGPNGSRRRRIRNLAVAAVVLLAAAAGVAEGRSGAPPAVFESFGSGLAVAAENGFDISVVNGQWRHRGHLHPGGQGRIASPWGEEMPIRFWLNSDGSLAVQYDHNATLHYTFDDFGLLDEVAVVTESAARRVHAGDRAQRAALGELDLYQLDYSPYLALVEQIARNHSADFLLGTEPLRRKLQAVGDPRPVGCVGDILQCTGAILLWAASVPTIAGACTAGSAVTLGAACLGAILAHEGAGAVAVGACVNAIENCVDREQQQGDPGGGCNGPGDGPE